MTPNKHPFGPEGNEKVDWDGIPFNSTNLLVYCLWYKDTIYVRHFNKVSEEWTATSIAELPGRELLDHLEQWMYKQTYPARILNVEQKVEKPHE